MSIDWLRLSRRIIGRTVAQQAAVDLFQREAMVRREEKKLSDQRNRAAQIISRMEDKAKEIARQSFALRAKGQI